MNNLIVDNHELKYQVVTTDGDVLAEEFTYDAAVRFAKGVKLAEGQAVNIVPVFSTGEHLLHG